MSTAVIDSTWGPSVVDLPAATASGILALPVENTAREHFAFLSQEVSEFDPELIVVVERRGTAILRALTENPDYRFQWSWQKVISSRVLEQREASYYYNKRILIFDDMKKRGSQVQRVLKYFSEIDPSGAILSTTGCK